MKKRLTMRSSDSLQSLADGVREELTAESKRILANWETLKEAYAGEEFVTKIRDKEIRTVLTTTSLVWVENPESCAAEIQGLWRNSTLGV